MGRIHGNKVQMTVTLDRETAELIEKMAERFGCRVSTVIEVCVEHERESLKMADRLLGKEGFDNLVKFLRWWKTRPSAFEGWTGELAAEG